LLLDNASLGMHDQKDIFLDTFESWKRNLEQIDDVCVVGVEL